MQSNKLPLGAKITGYFLGLVLCIHYIAFLTYLTTLIRQWDRAVKRTNRLMLLCGITLLVTGLGLIAIRYPAVNYWKVVPKSLLLVVIAGITAAHDGKPVSRSTWHTLIGLTVLTALIALWRLV